MRDSSGPRVATTRGQSERLSSSSESRRFDGAQIFRALRLVVSSRLSKPPLESQLRSGSLRCVPAVERDEVLTQKLDDQNGCAPATHLARLMQAP
jgi:hypothetical protein